MTRAYVSIGSNIDPERHVQEALCLLAASMPVPAISTMYRNPALGRDGSPPFINGVAAIEATRPPREVKYDVLRRIEYTLGRQRTGDPFAPRTIDLDLLLYGDQIIQTDELAIPDPNIARRPFIVIPLCELAPESLLPGDGRRICEIAAAVDATALEPLDEYTLRLRRMVALMMEGMYESKAH